MAEKNYSGVSWSRKEQCWKSKVKINGSMVLVGIFPDQKQAVIARDTKIIQHGLKLKLQILKPKTMKTGVELIAIERKRQIEELGYDYTNDALYADEQLSMAGIIYALPDIWRKDKKGSPFNFFTRLWPWDLKYWKPTPEDRVRELVKAGALIAAQIDYELNK